MTEGKTKAVELLAALKEIYPDFAESAGDLLACALADLRHIADKHDAAYALCDRKGYRLYTGEKTL